MIDRQYVFEIGGKKKGQKQIDHVKKAWIVKDDLEYTVDPSIPLWAFGFLY